MGIDRSSDDYEPVDDIAQALRSWLDTEDQLSQVGMVAIHLAPMDAAADQQKWPPTEIGLPEATAQNLADLLRADTAARRGQKPGDADDVDALRYAAARIGVLLDEHRGYGTDTPPEAVAVLAELARAVTAAARLASFIARQVTGGVRRGTVVPARGRGSDDAADLISRLENATEAVARTLGDTGAQQLERLRRQIGELDHREAVLANIGGEDGLTLAGAVVVECDTGGTGRGRYHARLFTPPGGAKPVVILGDLTDNRSTSIVNCVEWLAGIVADQVFHLAVDEVQWVQYIPAPRHGADGERAQLVTVTSRPPTWQPISHHDLEILAGGPVQRWHARDYTSGKLRAAGVPVQVFPGAARLPRT